MFHGDRWRSEVILRLFFILHTNQEKKQLDSHVFLGFQEKGAPQMTVRSIGMSQPSLLSVQSVGKPGAHSLFSYECLTCKIKSEADKRKQKVNILFN